MGHYNMADDWKTLRVPPGAHEQAKAQKEANDRTWGEQIVREEESDGEDTESDSAAASKYEYERWNTELENQQRLLEEHAKTRELLDQLPDRIAETLEARFR